jgi:hypothetical protein
MMGALCRVLQVCFYVNGTLLGLLGLVQNKSGTLSYKTGAGGKMISLFFTCPSSPTV